MLRSTSTRPPWFALIDCHFLGAIQVLAQEPGDATTPRNTLPTVEVTGTRLKRTDTLTSSPVEVITREDIEKSGKRTLSMPSNGVADDGQRTFVNLSAITLDVVDRVEVLKDGAFAIYGSDAIAGVVNIILRDQFEELSTQLGYAVTEYGDGSKPHVGRSPHRCGDNSPDATGLSRRAGDPWSIAVCACIVRQTRLVVDEIVSQIPKVPAKSLQVFTVHTEQTSMETNQRSIISGRSQ